MALYTHRSQAGRASRNRPGIETPDHPPPPHSRYPEAMARMPPSASLCARATLVVDLEEPRSLRPSIGWPASGAMQQPAYQLRGIHLPHTEVKIASVAAPFFMASGWPGKGHGSLG